MIYVIGLIIYPKKIFTNQKKEKTAKKRNKSLTFEFLELYSVMVGFS